MDDINKVLLHGQAISDPTFTTIGPGKKTPLCSFLLQCNEYFTDHDNKVKITPHVFTIESLGASAYKSRDTVLKGLRYQVEGYIRTGVGKYKDQVSIRTFAVTKIGIRGAQAYYQGIEQSLEIIQTSRDKQSATEKLTVLLQEAHSEGQDRE